MLHIFTTIAQHPKGVDLHLNNLRWAFDNPKKIHVFTFEWHKHVMPDDVNLITSNRFTSVKNKHYDFYCDLPEQIDDLCDNDVILLMQQDIFFTEKVDYLVDRAKTSAIVHRNLGNLDYFGVVDSQGDVLYPRFWEGATLFPASHLKTARKAGIFFGNRLDKFKHNGQFYIEYIDALRRGYIRVPFAEPRIFRPLDEFIENPGASQSSEKMFEFTLYSFSKKLPVQILDNSPIVHFQGPEKTHRRNPDVYDDIEILLKDPLVHRPHINNCVLLYFLSGAISPSKTTIRLLNWPEGISEFYGNLIALSKNANQWMSDDQLSKLEWIMGNIHPMNL